LEEEVESRLKAINTATTTILTTMGMQVERENKIILLEAFLINANKQNPPVNINFIINRF